MAKKDKSKEQEPKQVKKTEPKRTKRASTGTNVPQPDPKKRELALSHRDKFLRLHKTQAKANADMRAFGKEVKEDGLSMRQIKLMVELSTPEGEAAYRALICADLTAAQYQGAAVGQQLVLFSEPDRTPAVDIAYDEGQKASMTGGSPKPPYHPSSDQYTSWLNGWQNHQTKRLQEFKSLSPSGHEPVDQKMGFVPISSEELANQRAEAVMAGAVLEEPRTTLEKANASLDEAHSRTKDMAAKRALRLVGKTEGNA